MRWLVKNKISLISIFLFASALFLIGQNLSKPFYGEHDWNGVRYGNIARNYLRYGLFETKFGQIENSGQVSKEEFEYFTHYPPLLPLIVALSYKLFGISEWSTRLVPLLFSSGTIVLIFLIGNKLWNSKIGVIASLIALVTPMALYFGKTPVHEPLVMFFVLVAFYGYLMTKEKILFAKYIFISGLILAHLTTWAGYFLLPAIALVTLLKKDFNNLKAIIPYFLIPLAMFSFHIFHIKLSTGSVIGGDLLEAFFQRSSLEKSIQPEGFNLFSYLGKLKIWIFTLYSFSLTTLSIGWLLFKFGKFDESDWDLLILGIFGITYLVIFPNAAFIHNYLVVYLMPFMALAGARTIFKISETKLLRKFSFPLIVVLLSLIALEKKDYLRALALSNADRFAVNVGKAISEQTDPSDRVLVIPQKFSHEADKFLRFYGDRDIFYSNEDLEGFQVKVFVDTKMQKFEIMQSR